MNVLSLGGGRVPGGAGCGVVLCGISGSGTPCVDAHHMAFFGRVITYASENDNYEAKQ